MKAESRAKILNAYDEAFKLMGEPSFPSGVKRIWQHLEQTLILLKKARTRNGLEAVLAKEQEPSPTQLEAMIDAIRLLPYQMREIVPKAAKEAFPGPPVGRPRLLTPKDRQEINGQIGALLSEGVTLPDAVQRMSQHRGVSTGTIRRAWQSRSRVLV